MVESEGDYIVLALQKIFRFSYVSRTDTSLQLFHEKSLKGRRSQDGGGVGWGEHFLPHKFINRAFKRRVNSTKQLLNAGRGHQAPRKAAQLFERSRETFHL